MLGSALVATIKHSRQFRTDPLIFLNEYSRSELTTSSPTTPLRSVHTASLPELLEETASSLLVTTYQAGKLVVLRNDGGVLNTHYRNFIRPMGLATAAGKLAIGVRSEIWEYHNVPAVCPKLDLLGSRDGRPSVTSPGTDTPMQLQNGTDMEQSAESAVQTASDLKHDGCFLPRRSHTTGDVQIHEMAWVKDELWFINTAFSCLCTRSDFNSFEPRWRPPFVPHLAPGDCCHLNGMAAHDGRVRYVTALGESRDPGGWRENKCNGGILVDVDSGETIIRGLAMPHSPRWYREQLWLLESGDGSFGAVDLATGKYEPIVHLPGFTRGLSFLGPLAFIGLSQVRDTAVFSGIPIVDRVDKRTCGVWVVNIYSGQIVAFVRFEEAVQEIFAIEALPGIRYPDVINEDTDLIARSYVLGDEALKLVPADLRSN
jgi:uncharacterized protein (TIGR03032 family)